MELLGDLAAAALVPEDDRPGGIVRVTLIGQQQVRAFARPPAPGPRIAMASRAGRDACPEELDNQLVGAFLARCAARTWWTQTIAFTTVHARTSGS